MIGPAARLGALVGDRDRLARSDVLRTLVAGDCAPRPDVEAELGESLTVELLGTGDLVAHAGALRLRRALVVTHELAFAAPDDRSAGPVSVYLGPDSQHLTEAALRLAPRGERAVDLGAGCGLLASVLAARYRTVVATDLIPAAAEAADFSLRLNRRTCDHFGIAVVADLADGLRPESFDLVTANTPWVPTDSNQGWEHRPYADGGTMGVDLPIRFIEAARSLLRPGGTAVLLALDVTCPDGRRPLRDLADRIEADGQRVALLPTPLNRQVADFVPRMVRRQSAIIDAVHVAIVIGRPRSGDTRDALMVAAEALRRRWASRVVEVLPTPDG